MRTAIVSSFHRIVRWLLRASALAACAVLVPGAPMIAQPSGTLTARDIDDAIQLGMRGEPAPYLVHNWNFRGEETNQGVVALVYTPFVRVALAAKAAADVGETFEPSNVTEAMVEPVFYAAFRWYCCDGRHGDRWDWHPRTEPFDYFIAEPNSVPARGHPEWLITAKVLWVTREVERFGKLPYDDVVLVAGYPMSALRSHRGFAICRQWPSPLVEGGTDVEARVGRVKPDDLARWR